MYSGVIQIFSLQTTSHSISHSSTQPASCDREQLSHPPCLQGEPFQRHWLKQKQRGAKPVCPARTPSMRLEHSLINKNLKSGAEKGYYGQRDLKTAELFTFGEMLKLF